ncbi:hypothetical protein [Streptomyces sp. NRRL F-5123]|uniref:hypothetical protein n=1 Tax=Streptomyces sp. NRRL F-5123 TaxID=1463856 RepID=UPI0004E152B4|nr:hypothetical protein [Streptomyces sp. NRRL F-5123]
MAYALFLLLPGCPITALALAGYGFGRHRLRRAGRQARLRSVAALAGSAAAAVYTVGLLALALAVMDAEDGGADSSPLRPCRVAGEPERAARVTGYRVEYVPLRFVCETTDGNDYSAGAVPGWVGPAAAGFALASVVCACAAAVEGERRARRGAAAA